MWRESTFFTISLSNGIGWFSTVQEPPSLSKDCNSGVKKGQTGIKLMLEHADF